MQVPFGAPAVNFKTRFGEVDIVARDGKTTVFVEVKRREAEGAPEQGKIDAPDLGQADSPGGLSADGAGRVGAEGVE